jgi:ketohexokinase
MLKLSRQKCADQTISLEVEKERDNIDSLFSLADILIFSKHFVQGRGYLNADNFLNDMAKTYPDMIMVCPWGEHGAWAQDQLGNKHHKPASASNKVIDTLGAGDTFNAGLIDALCSGLNISESLQIACKLAGKKVGQQGLDHLTK